MSIAQRIAALNIQTESNASSQPPPPSSAANSVTTTKSKSNALASRIAAINNNNEDKSGGKEGIQDGGIIEQYKTEKPKVGKLKPLPAGTTMPVIIGFGPPPPSQKQREREERMELMKREAKKSTEVEETMDGDYVVLPTAVESSDNAQDDMTTEQHIVGKIKLPVGAVPMMLPITPGLPPIMLKKQREREERMEEMKREAKLAEETEEAEDATSPTTDENNDDALLSRPTVTGGKRRPKTRN
jgi:hypothetical protein